MRVSEISTPLCVLGHEDATNLERVDLVIERFEGDVLGRVVRRHLQVIHVSAKTIRISGLIPFPSSHMWKLCTHSYST